MSGGLQLIILVALILMNGVLAMAEIAVVSASKARLQRRVDQGKKGAAVALDLAENPNRFLATIQIGITLVGIVAGAFGGSAFAGRLADLLARVEFLRPYSDALGFVLVVGLITYASLIFGELVPKRVGMTNPEGIASLLARPMRQLARLTTPFVSFLSFSTTMVIRVLGIRMDDDVPVTEDEIHLLLAEGMQAGVFDPAEHAIVTRIFELNDYRVSELMTPRPRIEWVDISQDLATINQHMREVGFSYFPVYREDEEHILGMISAKRLWGHMIANQPIKWEELVQPTLYVPENTSALQLLDIFKQNQRRVALVIDEYSSIQGLISLTDIIRSILGEVDVLEAEEAVQSPDGTWLVDGMMLVDDFEEQFGVNIPQREKEHFQTMGGFVMTSLQRVPEVNDTLTADLLQLVVVAMDGNRVAQLKVNKLDPPKK